MRQLWTFANQLTLFRLLVIPLVLIAMLYGRHRWALGLFLVAGVTDGIDGLVARKLNQRTQLGAYLDPIADKFLLSSSFFILSLMGSVPWWVTILVLSRDFIILVTILVVALVSGAREFSPSTLGKWNTTIQIATVFAVMLHNAFRAPVTEGLAQSLVWLTAASTVASGVHYAVVISRRFQ